MKNFFILLCVAATCTVAGYSQTYRYDVNGDGVVTISDVTALYNQMLGIEPGFSTHEFVDLGLPSGTLWAAMNIGAASPEGYGYYFAWGETYPRNIYSWDNYMWCNGSSSSLTKYCTQFPYGLVDDITQLYPEDDAATAYWGPEWRMPTYEQIQELTANCSSEWTERNGVYGRLFTSDINGATLFFPAAGYHSSVGFEVGTTGNYWSHEIVNTVCYKAYTLKVDANAGKSGSAFRFQGNSVRAVRAQD